MIIFNDPKRIPEDYGIRIAGGCIIYFFVMRIFGLEQHYELRYLNAVIQVAGIYLALKKFKATHGKHLNYFRALAIGVATAAVGSLLFAGFLFIYMNTHADLLKNVIDHEPMGHYLNAYMISFIVALEGFFLGLLMTFVLINYLNTDEVNG